MLPLSKNDPRSYLKSSPALDYRLSFSVDIPKTQDTLTIMDPKPFYLKKIIFAKRFQAVEKALGSLIYDEEFKKELMAKGKISAVSTMTLGFLYQDSLSTEIEKRPYFAIYPLVSESRELSWDESMKPLFSVSLEPSFFGFLATAEVQSQYPLDQFSSQSLKKFLLALNKA